MLSSTVKPSAFSLILFLFFSFALLTHSAKIVKVKQICSETLNPRFCSEVLHSMPGGARGKDLVTLGDYTVDVAQANLSGTITLLKTLINNANDPELRQEYERCYWTYSKQVAGLLQEVKGFLKDGRYSSISFKGSLLMVFSSECVDEIPGADSQLVKNNKALSNFGDMITSIGDLLQIAE